MESYSELTTMQLGLKNTSICSVWFATCLKNYIQVKTPNTLPY